MVAKDKAVGEKISQSIDAAISHIKVCSVCKNLSESHVCSICNDPLRQKDKLCIVSSAKDIIVIEESGFYDGRYFVFDDAQEDIEKINNLIRDGVKEIIFAFAPSMSNDALIYFIEEKLTTNVHVSKIAQGVPTGVSLENVDMFSLGAAINKRIEI